MLILHHISEGNVVLLIPLHSSVSRGYIANSDSTCVGYDQLLKFDQIKLSILYEKELV